MNDETGVGRLVNEHEPSSSADKARWFEDLFQSVHVPTFFEKIKAYGIEPNEKSSSDASWAEWAKHFSGDELHAAIRHAVEVYEARRSTELKAAPRRRRKSTEDQTEKLPLRTEPKIRSKRSRSHNAPIDEMTPNCPFCNLGSSGTGLENDHAHSCLDTFPVARGHSLVIPRRHVSSLFDLNDDELAAVWRLVSAVREQLLTDLNPDGFNIGINDGGAAGQTIPHAHVHVIPRFQGDVPDPRGGVRWIIPEKAPYWNEVRE